jgi:putative intracellular protease/amidase
MEQQTIHYFVFDTLSDWEPSYALTAINNPRWQKHPGRFCVKTVGESREPVTSMGGVTILPDMTLDELDPAHSVLFILVGSDSWHEGKHKPALEKAKQFLAADRPVAAICGAISGLASAGLLDEKRHTGNVIYELQVEGYHGEAFYQQQPAVTDGNLITASGPSPIEFAYEIAKMIDLYTPAVLEAWYRFWKTNEASAYVELMKAVEAGS